MLNGNDKLFLAKFKLKTSFYMEEKKSFKKVTRIIIAKDINDATMKLHREYRVNYTDDNNVENNISFPYDYSSSNDFVDLNITEAIL